MMDLYGQQKRALGVTLKPVSFRMEGTSSRSLSTVLFHLGIIVVSFRMYVGDLSLDR